MALHLIDKNSDDRSSPKPNTKDVVLLGARKALGTTSVSPVSDATVNDKQVSMQYGTIRLGQTAYNTGTGLWMGVDSDNTAKLSLGNPSGNNLTWNGSVLSIAGALSATSGTIGGWAVGSTVLTAGSGGTTVGLDSGGVNPAIYAGSSTPSSAPFQVTDAGALTSTSGQIGGFTIGSSKLYGSTIQTAATVDGTHNGVVMDTSGLRGYSSSLGEVFNLPTDGSAPSFSAGTISKTTYTIDSSSVLETSATALSGAGGAAGVVINNSGVFAGSAGQSTSNANVQLKSDGTFSLYSNSSNAMTIDHGSNILLKQGGNVNFTSVSAPTDPTATLIATGTGNVDAGTHSYAVTFINAVGETNFDPTQPTVTTDSSHKQVSITNIATSSSASVTARKIYRTKAGGSTFYLLTTISDNTTTSYTDNTADASLGASAGVAGPLNSTAGGIYADAGLVLQPLSWSGGNYWTTTVNGATGALVMGGAGTSTNIDLELIPKGTGVVRAGANAAPVATTTDTQTLTGKTITDTSNSVSYATFTNPYKFSVYRNASWTSSSTAALVTFDTALFDTGSNYNTSTGKFTAPVAGFYWFTATVSPSAAYNAASFAALFVNGSRVKLGGGIVVAAGSEQVASTVTGLLKLSTNDYVQVYYVGDSGGSMYTGKDLAYFDGVFMSPN